MPALTMPMALVTTAVLTLQPALVPAPTPDPCAVVQAIGAGGVLPPTCPLPVIPEAEAPHAQGAADKPGDLLDLGNWFLTLPVGPAGDPDSIDQPELLDYRSEWFDLTPDGTGVVFRAPAGGVTTKNSKYPRSELREMNGEEKAA